MARKCKALMLGLCAFVLVACGGGEAPTPESPNISLSVRINRLFLSWNSVVAGEYNLYRDADGADGDGGFEFVGRLASSATAYGIPASVHLFDWLSEQQFYLEGCNLNACARTRTITIETDFNRLATGYFKASNATVGKADGLGASLGIDSFGTVMAVGAPFEDSDSTGIILGNGTLSGQSIDDRSVANYEPAAESGAAYIYAINNFGNWVQLHYIKAPDITTSTDSIDPDAAALAAQNVDGAGDRFGYAVAMSGSGEYLAVGAPLEDGGCAKVDADDVACATEKTAFANNTAVDSGAVYIYRRINSQWFLANYIKPQNVVEGARFGASLSFNYIGNTLAIGAPNDSMGDSGIFNKTNPNSEDDEEPDMNLVAEDSGAVYVLVRNINFQWELQAIVKSPSVVVGEEFGSVVALSNEGNTLAVGIPNENGSSAGVFNADDTTTHAFTRAAVGAVYVYSRDNIGDNFFDWFQQAYLKPPVAADNMVFGSALNFSDFGDDLIVGAPGANNDTGMAYLYSRDGALWDSSVMQFDAGTLQALDDGQVANASPGDRFGSSVALISLIDLVDIDDLDAGGYAGMIAVGAPGEDGAAQGVTGSPDDNASGAGAVYLFLQDSDLDWSRSRYIKASNSGPGFEFGSTVALTDTGSSLLVGAPGEPVSSGGLGPNPDGDDPFDDVNQNTDAPGAGAAYIY